MLCDLPNNVFEAAAKKNIGTYQRESKYGRKLVLINLLTLFSYWSNQMEKLIAAVKFFLLTCVNSRQRFTVRKTRLVPEASFRCDTIY